MSWKEATAIIGVAVALGLLAVGAILGGVECNRQKHETCQVYAEHGYELPAMCEVSRTN